jgi:hypothetical protein
MDASFLRETGDGANSRKSATARPVSVTGICWFLIVTGIMAMASTSLTINQPAVLELMARSPLPVGVQYAMSFGVLLVMVVCGVAMLQGRNWARLLYTISSGLSILVSLATTSSRIMMIPSVVIYTLFVFLLFQRNASRFFSTTKEAHVAERH